MSVCGHVVRALTYLLVGCVEQQVPLRSPHGQTEAVENVDSSQEETEEAQLFPALQPALQPVWEVSVLGTIVELVGSCQLARQVHQGQESDGNSGQCLVHHLYGNLVEVTLLVFHIWVDDISYKRIGKKEDGEGHSSEDGSLPARKQLYGYALNVPRGRQGAHIHRLEVELASELHNLLSSLH